PLVLYAVNGVMPIALCARAGMWWAVVLGTLAMGVPLALAAGSRRGAAAGSPRGTAARAALAGD
ncbi:MAG TPA: hypothetical protein VKA84_12265, partial [Gemmatimonadaceae bacterium]|nr:hypothetical protein [Gemmatimonadaceae bacterium]